MIKMNILLGESMKPNTQKDRTMGDNYRFPRNSEMMSFNVYLDLELLMIAKTHTRSSDIFTGKNHRRWEDRIL